MDPRRPTECPREGVRLVKHEIHGDYAGHVPLRDVTVEGAGVIEHVLHDGHAGHVPLREVAAERIG